MIKAVVGMPGARACRDVMTMPRAGTANFRRVRPAQQLQAAQFLRRLVGAWRVAPAIHHPNFSVADSVVLAPERNIHSARRVPASLEIQVIQIIAKPVGRFADALQTAFDGVAGFLLADASGKVHAGGMTLDPLAVLYNIAPAIDWRLVLRFQSSTPMRRVRHRPQASQRSAADRHRINELLD
ncbi:MAG TPA: hypothetical protein VMB34_15450 [Acetobacteraceae bacterium]|nr:hypothetical protein [Acetobacteraceae bacterium]